MHMTAPFPCFQIVISPGLFTVCRCLALRVVPFLFACSGEGAPVWASGSVCPWPKT